MSSITHSGIYIEINIEYVLSRGSVGLNTKSIHGIPLNTLPQVRAYIPYMPSLSQIKSTFVLQSG